MREYTYRLRMLSGTIAVLVMMILIVRYWPVKEKEINQMEQLTFQEHVLIDDTEITRQPSAPPPPPRPNVMHPVPEDEIIEEQIEFEEEITLVDNFPDLPEDRGTGLEGDEYAIVSEPQLPPSVVRIVEPSVPELPDSLKGRIEMRVNFLVNQDGSVQEASIEEIRKYDENRSGYEVLPFIQYGLMGATLQAALDWRFRAARDSGQVVRTHTTASFHY